MDSEKRKEYNKTYRHSHKGHVKTIYNHQIRNCKQRNHDLPAYSEAELLSWYLGAPSHLLLHAAWCASGYAQNLTPSIDRLDNTKSYTLANIELVTWEENRRRAYADTQQNTLTNSGLLNNGHRPIVQYSLNGMRLRDFISVAEAQRVTGIDHRGISDTCKGKRIVFHGFRWAYLDQENLLVAKLTPEFITKTTKRYLSALGISVDITTKDGCLTFDTIKSAANYYKISEHVFTLWANNVATPRATDKPIDIIEITLKVKSAIN